MTRRNPVAVIQTRICDRCQQRDDALPVAPWRAQRGNSKLQGDLCQKCWDEMSKTFRAAPVGRGKHQIVLVD